MLNIYVPNGSCVERRVPAADAEAVPRAVWYDLLDPQPHEIKAVEAALGLELPSREEMQEIEASSRLYSEGTALFMTVTMLVRIDSDRPETHAVSFVVTPDALVTLRYVDPLPFIAFGNRAQKSAGLCVCSDVALMGLLEAVVDRLADVLERVSQRIESVAQTVLVTRGGEGKRAGDTLQGALQEIGRGGTLITGVSESLMTLTRAVQFFATAAQPWLRKETKGHVKILTRDIKSLNDHAHFLSQKASFLLDATLGLINIEQNAIIKIFSVAAVAFMPPTLVASLYGMNFELMPELKWAWGYPMAIGLMVLSAVGPLLFFRRRGWL